MDLGKSLREACKEKNIKTASGLHDLMNRKGFPHDYQKINRLFNGQGYMVTLGDALEALELKSLEL